MRDLRRLLRAVARRLGGILAECNEAQRRLSELRLSLEPDRPAPDTYQEFLARTAGPLRGEPPAALRQSRRALH